VPATVPPDADQPRAEAAGLHPLTGTRVVAEAASQAVPERPLPSGMLTRELEDASSQKLRNDVDRVTELFEATLEDIERAGLTEHYAKPVREAMRAYMTIMDGAWEALAEERLTEVIDGPGYQHEIEKLTQWLKERRQRCAETMNAHLAQGAPLPRPSSLRERVRYARWKQQVKLYYSALEVWQQAIDKHGDARVSGQGLFRMHGYYGLTALRVVEHSALVVLRWATAGVSILVVLAYLAGIPFIVQQVSPVVIAFVLGLLLALAYYIVRLNVWKAALMPIVVGYALAPRQKVGFDEQGVLVVPTAAQRRRIRQFLEGWSLVVLVASPLIWLLATAGLGVVESIVTAKAGGAVLLSISGVLSVVLVLILPLSYLFFLPFVLTTQFLLTRDLAVHPGWEVPARRYPLHFSLILLPFLLGGALAGCIILRQIFALQEYAVLEIGAFMVKASTALYVLAFLVPYALLIDVPYRYGVSRWRLRKLKELRGGRRVVEEEIARLPLTHEHKDDLHELQYHLGWMDYYQKKMTEAAETDEAPFPVERRTTAFLLATPLPLILAAIQDIGSGETLSKDVFEVIQRLLSGGK
jgi:hypothetical protein